MEKESQKHDERLPASPQHCPMPCPHCVGSGVPIGDWGSPMKCEGCGKLFNCDEVGATWPICERCNGTLMVDGEACGQCNGNGFIDKDDGVSFRLRFLAQDTLILILRDEAGKWRRLHTECQIENNRLLEENRRLKADRQQAEDVQRNIEAFKASVRAMNDLKPGFGATTGEPT
jgi:hypothetical protein